MQDPHPGVVFTIAVATIGLLAYVGHLGGMFSRSKGAYVHAIYQKDGQEYRFRRIFPSCVEAEAFVKTMDRDGLRAMELDCR